VCACVCDVELQEGGNVYPRLIPVYKEK